MRKIYYDSFYEVPTDGKVFFVHRKIWINPDHKEQDSNYMGKVFEKEFFSQEDCSIIKDSIHQADEIRFTNYKLSIKATEYGIRELKPTQFFILIKSRLNNFDEIGKETKAYIINKKLEEELKTNKNVEQEEAQHSLKKV